MSQHRPSSAARHVRAIPATIAIGLLFHAAAASAFEQAFDSPAFIVSAPRLPSIPLGEPATSGDGHVKTARGRDTTYVVEVSSISTPRAGSTRACAGDFLRELVRRPNMPDRDNIYRAPFDTTTFLVLYILDERDTKQLHAHLLSSAAGTHCIDAHFSRNLRAGEEVDDWRASFAGATVRERGK